MEHKLAGYGYTQSGVAETALRQLAKDVCGAPAYLYSQDLDAVSLTPLAEDFIPAAEGRAFGPLGEVRWERAIGEVNVYTVLVLSEQEPMLTGSWERVEYEAVSQKLYLLGAWQPEEKAWIEVRLPHPLAYPLDGPADSMARLTAPAWEYRQNGMVQYIRLSGLEVEPIQSSGRGKEARDDSAA